MIINIEYLVMANMLSGSELGSNYAAKSKDFIFDRRNYYDLEESLSNSNIDEFMLLTAKSAGKKNYIFKSL